MMIGRKRCPRCAEAIRKEAQVCRYCGYSFPQSPVIAVEGSWLSIRALIGAAALIVLSGAAFLGYFASGDIQANRQDRRAPPSPAVAQPSPEPSPLTYEPLIVGATLEWSAETSPDQVTRQAGPYILTITKQVDEDMVAPLVKIAFRDDAAHIKGEALSPSYSHRVSAIQNRVGGPPVIMLQSFTGGAHCCNHVQLAGLSGGKLRVVELGTWDGDQIDLPKDLSGDGIADFVVRDDSFLYAFSAYAMSHSPPQILNVVGGRVRNVSNHPAFRKVYSKAMNETGPICRSAEDGLTRNGACPAYIAAAARAGKLSSAWSEMIAAYDATTDWELPTGCAVEAKQGCPAGREIRFKSYPEALLHFLKERGYISRNWQPPEFYEDRRSDDEEPLQDTTI